LFTGAVYTHNHPTDGSFSWKDIEFALTWKMREFRAVGPRFVYRLRRSPEQPWPNLDAVRPVWGIAEDEVSARFIDAIVAGSLDRSDADLHFWRTVCSTALPQVGLDYRTEDRTS
jgi:hypothetical protein